LDSSTEGLIRPLVFEGDVSSSRRSASYSLTVDEKRALLSGSMIDIEAFVGTRVSPWLKEQFEEAMRGAPYHDAYFAYEESNGKSGGRLVADDQVPKILEQLLNDEGK